MNQQVEAMKLAVRSLKELVPDDSDHAPAIQGQRKRQENALKALREALAQPQQEPSGWQKIVECPICGDMAIATGIPAAQRKPLTDEELEEIVKRGAENKPFHHWFARAIEAAHGIKGQP